MDSCLDYSAQPNKPLRPTRDPFLTIKAGKGRYPFFNPDKRLTNGTSCLQLGVAAL